MKLVLRTVKPAVVRILENYHEKLENLHDGSELKTSLLRIIDVIVESEGAGEQILERIAIPLLKHTIIDKLYLINDKFSDRIIIMFRDERSNLFWDAYNQYLVYSMKNEANVLMDILDFALQHFDKNTDKLHEILNNILINLVNITIDKKTLDVCIKITELVDSAPEEGGEIALAVFVSLSYADDVDYKLLSSLGNIIGKLSQMGFDCYKAAERCKDMIYEENIDVLVIAIEVLLYVNPDLISYGDLQRV